MSLILPFSDSSQYATGGIWAPTAANFPSCKHFWSCPQTDIGLTGLTDLIGSCNLVKPSGTIAAGGDAFSVFPNQIATGTTLSGTLTAVGSKYFLFMAVANWGATGGMALGDMTNGEGIMLQAVNFIADLDTTQALGTAFTLVSGLAGRATLVRTWRGAATGTTGQAQFEANITTTITDLGDAATTGVDAFTTYGATNKWSCNSGGVPASLYGAALFLFTALPSDLFIRKMLAWQTYQWVNGNKWIYPELKGVA